MKAHASPKKLQCTVTVTAHAAATAAAATAAAAVADTRADADAAEAVEAAARAPVNFPVNYAFSKRGCDMFAFGVQASLQSFPCDGGISCDVRNMYNACAQPYNAHGQPAPDEPGREAMFDFARRRMPAMIPCLRLVYGRPELVRLVKAEGPLRFPDGTGAEECDIDDEPLNRLSEPDRCDPSLVKFGSGSPQGKCLSTAVCVGAYHECMHDVQKKHPSARLIAIADDMFIGDALPDLYDAYATKVKVQFERLGLHEQVSKAALISPKGDLSGAPAAIPGSPHSEVGVLKSFKAVGTEFGEPEACKAAISKRLTKRLAPLDVVDQIRDSEGVSGTTQLRYNLLRRSAAPATGYIAKVTMPSISRAPLQAADDRLRASWETLVEAECTPDEWRQQAWEQARRPGAFAGFDIRSGIVELDAAYGGAVLACWPALKRHHPHLANISFTSPDAPQFVREAQASYERVRTMRANVATTHAAFSRDYFYTIRGGRQARFHPPAMPKADSLPSADLIFDSASKSKLPKQGKLAAVINHQGWLEQLEAMKTRDFEVASAPKPGASDVAHREASRFISYSQPYADGWLNIESDGTKDTTIDSAAWLFSAQRRSGLWVSTAVDSLRGLEETGKGDADDYFGDSLANKSKHHRTHHAALRGWYDATAAVATAPVVLGDKDNEARTRQFCASYVTDLAEIAAGSGGQDVCNELKVFSSMTKTRRMGRGSAKRGGTEQDVGHNYAFGNTEEKARYDNLGCKPRGRRCDGYFNHKTGKGWVAGHRGHYDDALRVKKNIVCILLHETSSGFSPPSATKIRRMGRAARNGVDRTAYSTRQKKMSFVTYHTQRISKNIVHCDATATLEKIAGAKARLSNILGSWRNAGS